jgi:hyperosmotically inducible protein
MKKTLRVSSLALASMLAMGGTMIAQANDDHAMNESKMDSDQPVTDTWITTKVKSELATTDGVKSLDISVKTVDGTVMLTGTQPNDLAVKKAIAAAKSIKGVKSVDSSGLKSMN